MSKLFKVIIIGGSIAGLTLAHALTKAGIDYVLLEKHHDPACQLGAGICLLPSGGRILEQLGIWGKLKEVVGGITSTKIQYSDGFSWSSQMTDIVQERFGHFWTFIDRRELVRVLYTTLPDKDRVFCKVKVIQIEALEDGGVIAHTEAGGSFAGSVLVGADGVHSRVRGEMERLSESLETHKTKMTTDYACVFGKSRPMPGMKIGEQVTVIGSGDTMTMYNGADVTFWFLGFKLPETYVYPDTPRFSSTEAQGICEMFLDREIQSGTYFRDIWERRISYALVPLQEGLQHRWYSHNIVCIGDSAHKMTYHTGQGGNLAIEDAAALANVLHQYVTERRQGKGNSLTLEQRLEQFAKARLKRIQPIDRISKFVTRLQASDGLGVAYFARYLLPYLDWLAIYVLSRNIAGAPILDFEGLPKVKTGSKRRRQWRLLGMLLCGCAYMYNMLFLVSRWSASESAKA